MSELPQRLVFGEVAEQYERARPSYPAPLIDDLVTWAGAEARALEVGAGTGKATRLVAGRGVAVLAIEPSAEMAAIARRSCARFPDVEVVESDFERWRPGPADRPFGLVFAAQAWHWVDPAIGYRHARGALAAGGRLVAFWNRPAWGDSPMRDALTDVYRRIAPEMSADGPLHPANHDAVDADEDWEGEIGRSDGLADPEIREYPWSLDYTPDQYVEMLDTLSDVRRLAQAPRRELLGAVRGVVAEHGARLTMEMVTRTCIARAV